MQYVHRCDIHAQRRTYLMGRAPTIRRVHSGDLDSRQKARLQARDFALLSSTTLASYEVLHRQCICFSILEGEGADHCALQRTKLVVGDADRT